jgi:hypothetical protein
VPNFQDIDATVPVMVEDADGAIFSNEVDLSGGTAHKFTVICEVFYVEGSEIDILFQNNHAVRANIVVLPRLCCLYNKRGGTSPLVVKRCLWAGLSCTVCGYEHSLYVEQKARSEMQESQLTLPYCPVLFATISEPPARVAMNSIPPRDKIFLVLLSVVFDTTVSRNRHWIHSINKQSAFLPSAFAFAICE